MSLCVCVCREQRAERFERVCLPISLSTYSCKFLPTDVDLYIAPDARYSDGSSTEFEPVETVEQGGDDDLGKTTASKTKADEQPEFIDVEVLSDSTKGTRRM